MQGLVITKNADLFSVESGNEIYNIKPSGKTKEGGIFVGDRVEFGENITKVLPRKNLLIRPRVANIDRIFIVLSPSPRPDFALVDKLIIYCVLNDIEPIIVLNKIDLAKGEFVKDVYQDYGHSFKIVEVCAKTKNVQPLAKEIKGLCVLAGQSAVGKSSLINALLDSDEKIGSLSKKIERGKQTTRIVKLFKLGQSYLADTAGFSLLDLGYVSKLEVRELSSYYPEFLDGRARCKYRSCLHEGGKECGVVEDLQSGKISKRRYENYLKILDELKNNRRF